MKKLKAYSQIQRLANIKHTWTGSFHYNAACWQLDIIIIIKSLLLRNKNSANKLKKISWHVLFIFYFLRIFACVKCAAAVLNVCSVSAQLKMRISRMTLLSPRRLHWAVLMLAGDGDHGGYLCRGRCRWNLWELCRLLRSVSLCNRRVLSLQQWRLACVCVFFLFTVFFGL